MTATQLLLALRARWLTVLAVAALFIGLGAAVVLLSKPQYTVNATLMLDVRTADPIGSAMIPALGIGNYIATQADLIRSARVLERAITATRIDADPELAKAWRMDTGGRGSQAAWLADRLSKLLLVTPARESNMIALAFTDGDPQRAATFLQAVLDAYIGTTIDLRTDAAGRNTQFFEAHVRQLRDNLARAQAVLTAQQREAGMLANDERLDVETSRLAELSTQLLGLQVAEGDSGSRRQLAANQLANTQEAMSNPLIGSLTGDIARQEARLNELGVRLGDQHPDVLQARSTIATLKARLDDELRRLGSSLGMTNGVHQARVAQLRQAYDQQRDKVARLKALRDQAAVLQRDVENANQAYSATVARARQAGMESQAMLTNAAVVMAPTPPANPSKPRPALTLVLASLAGLLLGAAAAVVRELRDRHLRSADDVLVLLGQALVCDLPADVVRQRRLPQLRHLLAAAMPRRGLA